MKISKRKIWIFPLPIFIAILIVLFGGGVLIYALTKTTEKAGPVGYWKFDEGSGYTAYDASGNANNGTLTNFDFNDTSNWTTGKVAGALKFDGSNDYISILHSSSLMLTTDATWEFWTKLDATSNTMFVRKYATYNQDGYYLNYYSNVLTFACGTAGNLPRIESASGVLSTGVWTHIVIVKTGTTGKAYLNGQEITMSAVGGTLPTIVANTEPTEIGAISGTGQYLNGLIDEVKIYNRALTAAEVAWDYNRGGPVGWWKFDEGSGSSVYDSSGNSNTGTWAGTGTTHWAEGKINGAGQFNGSDDYVSAPSSASLNITNAVTLEVWVYDPPPETNSNDQNPQ